METLLAFAIPAKIEGAINTTSNGNVRTVDPVREILNRSRLILFLK
jgi:hypothetical protein